MEWFRSHHGAPLDPKWLVIARLVNASERNRTQRTQVNAGMVASVFWALMDHASQQKDRGDISSFDAESIAEFYGYESAAVEGIIAALTAKGIIENNRLAAWDDRQPKREDGSADRAKAWRERKRTQANANEHRGEEIRVEKKERGKRVRAPKPPFEIDDDFQGWAKTECPLVPLDSLPTLLASYRDWQKNNGAPNDERAGFRNWCRRENKYAAERAAKALLADSKRRQPLPGDAPLMTYDEPWPQRLRSWRTGTPWNWAQWGPKPGDPGCRVPASLLEAA